MDGRRLRSKFHHHVSSGFRGDSKHTLRQLSIII